MARLGRRIADGKLLGDNRTRGETRVVCIASGTKLLPSPIRRLDAAV